MKIFVIVILFLTFVQASISFSRWYHEPRRVLQRQIYSAENGLNSLSNNHDPDSLEVVNSSKNLLLLYSADTKYAAQADALYKNLLRTLNNAVDVKYIEPLMELTEHYRQTNQSDKGSELNKRIFYIEEHNFRSNSLSEIPYLKDLFARYDSRGDYGDAENVCRTITATKEKVFGVWSLRLIRSIEDTAAMCEKQKNYAEAEKLYLRAIDILVKNNKTDTTINMNFDIDSEIAGYNPANRLNPKYLIALEGRIFDVLSKIPDPNDLEIKVILKKLAMLYRTVERGDEADVIELRILEYERIYQYTKYKKDMGLKPSEPLE